MTCHREGCDNPLTGRATKWCGDYCRKRACEDAHRAECGDCAAPLGGGSTWRGDRPRRCADCERRRRNEAHEVRLREFAAMYNAGLSMVAIANRLGWSETSNASVLAREAREHGLIGYRYKGCEARRVAA